MPLNLLHIGITLLIALLPMSRYPETQKVRKPAVAGSFYPASAKEIKSMIGPWMHPADGSQAPQALIVPHAGYVFSGEVAASAFSRIPRGHAYKRIFLLGPSHRVGFAGASVDTLYAFAETPLGKVPVDNALAKGLIHKGDGAFTFRSDAHDREHCLEVQLPFLQMLYDEVPPIVPIVIGTQRLSVLQQIAEALEPYFNEDTHVIKFFNSSIVLFPFFWVPGLLPCVFIAAAVAGSRPRSYYFTLSSRFVYFSFLEYNISL